MQCWGKEKVRGNFPPAAAAAAGQRVVINGSGVRAFGLPASVANARSQFCTAPTPTFCGAVFKFSTRTADAGVLATGSQSNESRHTASKSCKQKRRACTAPCQVFPLRVLGNIAPPARCSLADFSFIIFSLLAIISVFPRRCIDQHLDRLPSARTPLRPGWGAGWRRWRQASLRHHQEGMPYRRLEFQGC